MKKWLSMALICSLLATSLSIGGNGNIVKADESSLEDTVESVIDLDKYENNDLIVVYKDKSMSEKKMTKKTVNISELAEEDTVDTLTDNSMIVKLDNKQELEEAIEAYSNDSSVAYVQPNYVYHTLADVTITDTDYKEQWGMNNDGTYTYSDTIYSLSGSTGRPGGQRYTSQKITIEAQEGIDVNAEEAWSLGTGANREVVVAFIDTGIKYDHEELKDNMWVNPKEIAGDGIDNDGNGYVDDIHGWNFYAADQGIFSIIWPGWGSGDSSSNGNNTYYNANSTEEDSHATHCAGVVAAQADGTGVVGIAHQQNVKIMTVKVLGGNDGTGTTESVVKGIKYAADNGANICNLSLGGTEDDQALKEVIEENSDMLFCVAAGNGDRMNIGYDMDGANAAKEYPACYEYDNIITVANIQCDGELHYSSNYGNTSVDIAAPGAQIYSTSTAKSGYEYMTGTSMAAPMISGIAAMLYSYYNDVTIYDVKNMILNSAKKLPSLEGKVGCGGMADTYAALMQKDTKATPSMKPSAIPSITPSMKPSVTPSVTPSMTASVTPSITPTMMPTPQITSTPQVIPTLPISQITSTPQITPVLSSAPTQQVTSVPSAAPAAQKEPIQTITPIQTASTMPSIVVTNTPTTIPTNTPTPIWTGEPSYSKQPSATRTPEPTKMPTSEPESTDPPLAGAPDDKATLGTAADKKLDNAQIVIRTNKKAKLVVYNISSTTKVTWKSADKSVATITSNGIITAKAPGKSVITATLSSGKKLSCIAVVQPVTPASVKAAQVKKKLKVNVRWGKVTGIDGYEVLRATSKNGKYKVIKDVKKAGTKYYIDKNVVRKTYYYKVRAYKEIKNGSRIYSALSLAHKVKVKK